MLDPWRGVAMIRCQSSSNRFALSFVSTVADLRVKQVKSTAEGIEFLDFDEEDDDEDYVDVVNESTVRSFLFVFVRWWYA